MMKAFGWYIGARAPPHVELTLNAKTHFATIPLLTTFVDLSKEDEGTRRQDMKQLERARVSTHEASLERMASAVVDLGGLSGLAVADGAAGAAASVVVSPTKNATFGTIFSSGKTVYRLKASKTACTTQCMKIWPELLLPKGVTKAQAGLGVNAAKLGSVRRGGDLQVTYARKPLYYFVGDTRAGQVNGNITDTWGKWSDVVTVKSAQASSGSGSTAGSGSGGSTAGTGGVSF